MPNVIFIRYQADLT